MTTTAATKARDNLYSLIDQVNAEHCHVVITGKRGNAVLIGEDDWDAIVETMYLNSVPGLVDAIHQGHTEGIEAGSQELDW